MTIEAPHLLEC